MGTMLSTALRRIARPSVVLFAAATSPSSLPRCDTTTQSLVDEAKKKSLKNAHDLYEQAAELGDLEALYRVAQNYLKGLGTVKDVYRAAELFAAASERGHAQSMYRLAILYRLGKGVEKDMKKSNELCKKAAEAGCVEAMGALTSSNLNSDAKADIGRGRLSKNS